MGLKTATATTAPSKPDIQIAPSILASDLSNLFQEVLSLTNDPKKDQNKDSEDACCQTRCDDESGLQAERKKERGERQWVHYDVMDGKFVPNLTFGAPTLSCLTKALTKARCRDDFFFDCHLMVEDPQALVTSLVAAGADQITCHIESFALGNKLRGETAEVNITTEVLTRAQSCLEAVKSAGVRFGIAVKPSTPLTPLLRDWLRSPSIDMVLVMTVEPGFGGQKFQVEPLSKARELRALMPEKHIQVDGGVTLDNCQICVEAGANVLVAGTAIYGTKHRKATVDQFRTKALQALGV